MKILLAKFGFILLLLTSTFSCAQKQDKIIGIWTVNNEMNKATYEIIEYKNKFYGKIHKYSSTDKKYVGDNKEKDYFLIDIENIDGEYVNGKMYAEDGSYYKVIFSFINKDELKVSMTIENYPYSEIWKRKI